MYYFLAPMIAWFVAGTLKYCINYMRFGKEAKSRVGNGGFPSNHTTIVTTVTFMIGFQEGFSSPTFGLGVAVIMVVIIDATGLRRHVGNHAVSLNQLSVGESKKHRESMGHTKLEVLGGLLLGILLGFLFHLFI
ncbi:divergent PAP2 family protein [Cohnella yongneupensis]|uniref:Divergent PAP2 family protein n=1 Tax=Cohnella yongneupensis TaxID=425006 RepID=A0ABW0QZJ7_9BACL